MKCKQKFKLFLINVLCTLNQNEINVVFRLQPVIIIKITPGFSVSSSTPEWYLCASQHENPTSNWRLFFTNSFCLKGQTKTFELLYTPIAHRYPIISNPKFAPVKYVVIYPIISLRARFRNSSVVMLTQRKMIMTICKKRKSASDTRTSDLKFIRGSKRWLAVNAFKTTVWFLGGFLPEIWLR